MKMLLLALLLWPAWAQADTDDFVLGLFSLERCGFMSSSDDASVDRADTCRDMLDQVDATLAELSGSEDPQLLDALAESWALLREAYDGALDDPDMFRDHYTVDEIRNQRARLTELLEDRLPTPPNPMALAVLFEQTATEYIWRASSIMGGGLTSGDILDLESMVMNIDAQFAALVKRYPNDIQLRQASTRYQFIRGSLLNYNTDMVPYLVDRYATGVTQALSRVARR